jgi:hypothetical protein
MLIAALSTNTPDWINVLSYGADPTGVRDSTAAMTAALTAAPLGGTVYLPTGIYTTSAPLVVPPYVAIQGDPATSQVPWVHAGSVIKPAASFSAGSYPVPAVILLLSQAAGGYPLASEEQKFRNIMISGEDLPAGVHGIGCYGNVRRVQLRDILISRVTGNGIHQQSDPSGNQPDAWTAIHVFSRYNGGCGYFLRSADSNWTKCLSTNSGAEGWLINTTSNSLYIGCRSEHSGTVGYRYQCANNGQASGSVAFVGCSTDQSTTHGIELDGPRGVPVLLSGCYLRRDGANNDAGGGGFAGVFANGYPGSVIMTGCAVFPGVDDNGAGTNSPQFGLKMTGSTYVQVSGCRFHAASTPVSDDGTNTAVVYDGATSFATGLTSTPVSTPGVSLPSDGTRVPEDYALVAWNMDPSMMMSANSLVRGTIYLCRIKLRRPRRVSRILLGISRPASGTVAGENFVALVDAAGAIRGASAVGSLDGKLATAGVVTQPLPAPCNVPAGDYYIAILVNAATPPAVMCGTGPSMACLNLGSAPAQAWWAVNGTAATALPASFSLAGNSSAGALPVWAAVS